MESHLEQKEPQAQKDVPKPTSDGVHMGLVGKK